MVGERKQTDFKYSAYSLVRESCEIELHNHKDTDQEVLVIEPMYRWSNWIIEKIGDGYLKKASRLIHIPVKAPANGSKKIAYTVYYTAHPAGEKGVEPIEPEGAGQGRQGEGEERRLSGPRRPQKAEGPGADALGPLCVSQLKQGYFLLPFLAPFFAGLPAAFSSMTAWAAASRAIGTR